MHPDNGCIAQEGVAVVTDSMADRFLQAYVDIRTAISLANDVLEELPEAPAGGHCVECDGDTFEIIEDMITATGLRAYGDESGYQLSSKHVEYSEGMLLPVMICSNCNTYYQHPQERGEWI